jgi:hypothetical protein
MDLGECPKIHSEPLKQEYEETKKDYGYEYDLYRHLESFVVDCDRKIVKAKKRLELTQANQVL